MTTNKYLVTLADDERQAPEHLLHRGTHATRNVSRARIRLKAAAGGENQALAAALSVGRATSNASASASSRRAWGRWQTIHGPEYPRHWMRR
jgi:hypothetical protein